MFLTICKFVWIYFCNHEQPKIWLMLSLSCTINVYSSHLNNLFLWNFVEEKSKNYLSLLAGYFSFHMFYTLIHTLWWNAFILNSDWVIINWNTGWFRSWFGWYLSCPCESLKGMLVKIHSSGWIEEKLVSFK